MRGLFCAKRIRDGKWVYGYYVHQYESHEIFLPGLDDEGFDRYHVDPETVRPFTGLYDCTPWEELTTEEQALFLYPLEGGKRSREDWRGRPIFKGDIVKHFNMIGLGKPDEYEIGAIYWHEETCKFKRTVKDDNDCEVRTYCKYKIIGNIYDDKLEDFDEDYKTEDFDE